MSSHHRLLVALGVAVSATLLTPVAAAEPTNAQKARAGLSAEALKAIRTDIANMRSSRRWPTPQQDRFTRACMKGKERDPSINKKMCGCMLEVVMDRFTSFGDYAKDLADNGGTKDEQTVGLTGLCLAAYGT